MDKPIQIHPAGFAQGVAVEPAFQGGDVEAVAVVDQPGGGVGALGGKAKRLLQGAALGLQLAKGGVTILCHCGARAVKHGHDVALAVVDRVMVRVLLADIEQSANAAAQVQAPEIFPHHLVALVAVLQGQSAYADDSGLLHRDIVAVTGNPGQERVEAIGVDRFMGHPVAVGMGHGAQPVPGVVGGVEGVSLGGIPLDEITVLVVGELAVWLGKGEQLVEIVVAALVDLRCQGRSRQAAGGLFRVPEILGVVGVGRGDGAIVHPGQPFEAVVAVGGYSVLIG